MCVCVHVVCVCACCVLAGGGGWGVGGLNEQGRNGVGKGTTGTVYEAIQCLGASVH